MTLDGQLTTLYTFCTVSPCLDGARARWDHASRRRQFSTALRFRWTNLNGGTLFKITTAGDFKRRAHVLFHGHCADGNGPGIAPIQGSDGSLIGTAHSGGPIMAALFMRSLSSGHFQHRPCFPLLHKPVSQRIRSKRCGTGCRWESFWHNRVRRTIRRRHDFEITSNHQYKLLHSFTYGNESGAFTGLTLANDGKSLWNDRGDQRLRKPLRS